ncbi:MAG: GerMN domain-containing protein [Candidatus Caldatribacteriota bacterium]|nr:GerMN domain-containing protein [Candidatus Caldatribacteriota bacterium]
MIKNRKLKKKRNSQKIIFTLLIIVVLVIAGYLIFNKFIVPVWERYKEKPVITKEIPYEEERKEVQPVPTEEMVEVNLYFSDSQAMYLVAEKRKLSQVPSLARQAVVELIKGPESSELYPTIPEGTQVNEVYIADDIVYIDLSEEIFKNHPGGSSGELMTVYSIVNTLTEIPPIKGVQILVEGNEMKSLVGHIDISVPLLRDGDWIKPEN